jgi:hypothetical protein
VLGPVDAGQHEHGLDARAGRAGDVRVEAVADEQRVLRPEPRDGLLEDRRLRLARDGREAADGRVHGRDQRPVPGATPRDCGIVQSVLVAIHGIPPSSSGSFKANAASARSFQPTSGANP